MKERVFGSRKRLAVTAGLATVGSVGVGLATNHWIRTASSDVGLNLVVIVLWVATMMAAAGLQSLLAGDLLWGERWRRRALLGWVPDTDEMDADDLKDRSWVLYGLMAGLLALGYAGQGAANGNFFGWYQFRGFELVRLRSDDPAQRLEAMLELADHDDPQILAQLVPRVHDPDPQVRAEAIGVMGDKRVESAREELFKALEGADVGVRAAAAEALGKLRGQGVLQALTGLLSRERDVELRRGVLSGLGLLKEEGATRVIAGVLGSPDEAPAVRAVAAWALAELRSTGAEEAVAAALSPANAGVPQMQCAALHALAQLAGGPKGGAAEAPPPAMVAAFEAQPGQMGPMCERELVTARAKARCFGKLNRPSDVPYEGDCTQYQIASPEAFRVKALRATARAAGKSAMPWFAKVNNDEEEPAAIRSWAAELYLGLKAL